jgi:TET-associated glycosyltransferase-like protein
VIVSPSFGRAGRVTSDRVFHDLVVVVPESQAEEYAAHPLENGGTYHPMPDKFEGNISRKRNWILDTFAGDLVMVDDDYDYLGMVEGGKQVRLEWESIQDLITNGFQMAEDVGVSLWGLNVQVDPRFYREYSPVAFLSPVLGPFVGVRPSKIRYDPDLWLKEDYDFFLQHIHRAHRVLRFNKYHYKVDHFDEAGGVVGQRNLPEEARQLKRLVQKWGSSVVSYDLTRSVNPRIRVPLVGI